MKLVENLKKTLKNGLEEIKKFVNLQNFLSYSKALIVGSAFVGTMLWRLRESANNYFEDEFTNVQFTEQNIESKDIKNDKKISYNRILELAKKSEELNKLLTSSVTNYKTYKYTPLEGKYKFLNGLESYTKSTIINDVTVEEYENKMKNSKGNFKNDKPFNISVKKKIEITETEKALSSVKIYNLKNLDKKVEVSVEETFKENNMAKDKYEAYLNEIKDKLETINYLEKVIGKIGHDNFGTQLRNIDELNKQIEGTAIYIFSMQQEINEINYVRKNKIILEKEISITIEKMNKIIKENKLNNKALDTNDKNYFKNSTNVLLQIKEELKFTKDVDNINKFSKMIKDLDNNINPNEAKENNIQYSKNIDNSSNYEFK